MLNRIAEWLADRREMRDGMAFDRGFGNVMVRHYHHGQPLEYIEEDIYCLCDEYGDTPYLCGAREALRLIPSEEEIVLPVSYDDKPRTVEHALLKAQSGMISGITEHLIRVRHDLDAALEELTSMRERSPLEHLEADARQFGSAQFGEIYVHRVGEGDFTHLVHWHRHPNGAMTRIDRDIAERDLLTLQGKPAIPVAS